MSVIYGFAFRASRSIAITQTFDGVAMWQFGVKCWPEVTLACLETCACLVALVWTIACHACRTMAAINTHTIIAMIVRA